jgi:hypothetical protein
MLCIASMFSGCIMMRGGNLEQPAIWPIQKEAGAKSIRIKINEDRMNENFSTGDPTVKTQALKAYTDSGLFRRIGTAGDPWDITAEVALSGLEPRTNGFLRIFNGISLTLIPDRIAYSPTMTTTFRDQEGKVIATIQKSEDVSLWIELFLLFGMPFVDGPGRKIESVYYDLHRATISQAHEQGTI